MTRIHATCVAIAGRGVLIVGRSGSGKSDLALRLLDRGARLVSDDYTQIDAREGKLIATAPATIAGRMEVRGIGIIAVDPLPSVPIALRVDALPPERLPEPESWAMAGVVIPVIRLSLLEPSAPLKVEFALRAMS